MACTVWEGVTIIEKLRGWPYLASYCCSSCLALVRSKAGSPALGT